jgi:outer membrane receptor protein involved in Fe transport
MVPLGRIAIADAALSPNPYPTINMERSMISRACLALAAQTLLTQSLAAHAQEAVQNDSAVTLEPIVVNAQRLDQARNQLLPEVGSSVYRITQADIAAMPQGENTPLNQVLLQAPGIADDSYGQLHVRGEHADLQYRIDGIMIPEPISGFGQSFDARIIDQVNFMTGALPAQYGDRTAGVVDIRTKEGDTGNGGTIDVFGGSHGTLQSSAEVFGSQGPFSYYLTGSLGENDLGVEAPTTASDPLHDHMTQGNGFGYLSYLLSPLTRVSVMFGATANHFDIPNTPGLTPAYTLSGVPTYASANLNETQSELYNFGLIALQGTDGDALDYQIAAYTRYTRTLFNPDAIGDLVFNGVASSDFHNNTANGLQADVTYRLGDSHTVRAGVSFEQQHADFANDVAVFSIDANGNQLSSTPYTISDNSSQTGYEYGLYLQDEWKLSKQLTLNYGLRFDGMNDYVTGSQLSPRIGIVYQPTNATTLHAGYARYFTPPPFELVSNTAVSMFNGTTNQQPSQVNDPVKPERSNYFDIGVSQRMTRDLSLGIDAYYKQSRDLIDEGQFGTALIYTPFNYAYGRVFGVELTESYKHNGLSTYLNLAWSKAQGKDIESAQFNFGADELAYAADHYIYLDHDQRVTGSFGAAYELGRTTLSLDGLIGSGLRSGFDNTDKVPWYWQLNLAVIEHFNAPYIGKFDGRIVLINAFNSVYELRDGSGIGVEAPQYGPQRAIYAGMTKYF